MYMKAIRVMIRSFFVLLLSLYLFADILGGSALGAQGRFVPGEIIVRFKSETAGSVSARSESGDTGFLPVASSHNIFHLSSKNLPSHLSHIRHVKVESGSEVETCELYRKMPEVLYAEPNYLYEISLIPNDPLYDEQWALPLIEADAAWDVESGDGNVIIAVVDTGIDYIHEDLAENIWRNPGEIPYNRVDDDDNGYIDDVVGWDFVDAREGLGDFNTPDNDPMDDHGHGTHVAGIAAAVTGNRLGIAGACPHCRIMPVRAGYRTLSGGGVLENEDAARAIVYAAENGARVINLSWGDSQRSYLIEDAIDFAAQKGALICAAAGNEKTSQYVYPAACDNPSVMAVGAGDQQDRPASFTNYGNWVHVSAPGVAIESTFPNDTYSFLSGTSMATPYVAGQAGLLFSHFPEWTAEKVRTRIMRTVDVLPEFMGKNCTSGRIDLLSALLTAEEDTVLYLYCLDPDEAHEGDLITIFGEGFGAEQDNGSVTFSPGISGTVLSWNNTVITCKVPPGTESGPITVKTGGGTVKGLELTLLRSFYTEEPEGNDFLNEGTAQKWQADDRSWLYPLPFSFPYFGKRYDSVYVCSNGYLDFTESGCGYKNSTAVFKTKTMIAPLWADLTTAGTSRSDEDIYIHSPSSDSVCIRWAGEHYDTQTPVNFEVILYRDGRIRFNYGKGNEDISPTVGISGGDGLSYHLASSYGQEDFSEAPTMSFSPLKSSFTLALDLGWNLISFPIMPENCRPDQVFGALLDHIEVVWGYRNGKWQSYIPNQPVISDLQTIETEYGYWVKTDKSGLSLPVQGYLSASAFPLSEGWNLTGFTWPEPRSLKETGPLIGKNFEIIWSYEDGLWKRYIPSSSFLSDLHEVEPGRGYWISILPD